MDSSPDAELPRRRAVDAPPPPKKKPSLRPEPGSGNENLIAAFLFAVIVGCAGIWLGHNRCPGALRMAATAVAPMAMAAAVPIAGVIAMLDRNATRQRKIYKGATFGFWAGAAALSLGTAFLLATNEKGEVEPFTRACLVVRRETVPAPSAGVRDWIVVLRCSDRMSLVRVDVDRKKWWEHEPGVAVQADLRRGRHGFEWVVDVPGLGPPIRNLP